MQREIGSEFWDVPISAVANHLPVPPETAFFLSGRCALDFIIREIQSQQRFDSVMLPSYCCETMIAPFLAHGITPHFYPVYFNEDGHLIQTLPPDLQCDAILVLDYFGYASQCPIPDYGGIVIRDVTHSLFTSAAQDGHYIFGSLRKWAGFYTGGFACKRDKSFALLPPQATNEAYVSQRRCAMAEKQRYLCGEVPEKHYLQMFEKAEALLDCGISGGTTVEDLDRLAHLDTKRLQSKRRENAAMLISKLSTLVLFPELRESDCPLFVPIRVSNGKRDALRRFLIGRAIYCPIHWPVSTIHRLTAQTQTIYEQELSLVCDQRYTPMDMARIAGAVLDFFEREKI